MRIFNKNGKPSADLNAAVEQVKTWQRYFHENDSEKNRIFGAVARFRYILVAGEKSDWDNEEARKWRTFHNSNENIEIRTIDVFLRALEDYKKQPIQFWSFEENPKTIEASKLENYWKKYGYMDQMRKIYN